MPILRQGDVLLVGVDTLPPNVVTLSPEVGRCFVLVRGEQSGHAHTLPADARVSMYRVEGRSAETIQYVTVRGPSVALGHEEHASMPVPRGHYRVVVQRQYDPATAGAGWLRAAD